MPIGKMAFFIVVHSYSIVGVEQAFRTGMDAFQISGPLNLVHPPCGKNSRHFRFFLRGSFIFCPGRKSGIGEKKKEKATQKSSTASNASSTPLLKAL